MVIGIDPGLNGGIACLSGDYRSPVIEWAVRMPVKNSGRKAVYDVEEIVSLLRPCTPCHLAVVIEQQHTFPGQGVASQGKQMYGFGLIHGIVMTMCLSEPNMSCSVISARRWQKVLDDKDDDGEPVKDRVVRTAMRIFGDLDGFRMKRSRKLHQGIADSLMIALYGLKSNLDLSGSVCRQ